MVLLQAFSAIYLGFLAVGLVVIAVLLPFVALLAGISGLGYIAKPTNYGFRLAPFIGLGSFLLLARQDRLPEGVLVLVLGVGLWWVQRTFDPNLDYLSGRKKPGAPKAPAWVSKMLRPRA